MGKVYLVGAGPGDDGLITVKGFDCLKKADVLVYDRLSSASFLNNVPKSCECIYVGKMPNKHTLKQEEINELLYQKSLKFENVVRLKGGDPYVFGRGSEEGIYLKERNVEFEVIPGISSSIGGLAYAGIPITHRNISTSFHVITGHEQENNSTLNWKSLASLNGTLVFLMGVKNLENIVLNLLKEGKKPKTPCAIITWASTPKQKTLISCLENVISDSINAKVVAPSLIVIGEVVSFRDSLNFFENKPLFGKKIIVTRARHQASSLSIKLKSLGAEVIELPTIKMNPINESILNDSILNLNKFTHLVLTSQNGVNFFFESLFKLGKDSRYLSHLKISAIGSSTANKLKDFGIIADFVPDEFVAEDLFNKLKENLKPSDSILIARANDARSILYDLLSNVCDVKEVKIYETLPDSNSNSIIEILNSKDIDYITFTSSSTVKNFIGQLKPCEYKLLENIDLISIGPITSKTIESFNQKVKKQAKVYTIDGIIETLLELN